MLSACWCITDETGKHHKAASFWSCVAALLYSGTIIYLIAYKPEIIPPLFIEGHGLTPLKIYLEYSIIVLHIITIILFLRYLKAECAKEYRYMILSLLLCIFSEISFAAYTSVYDTYNLLGHLYKIIAYYLLLRQNSFQMFKNLTWLFIKQKQNFRNT